MRDVVQFRDPFLFTSHLSLLSGRLKKIFHVILPITFAQYFPKLTGKFTETIMAGNLA